MSTSYPIFKEIDEEAFKIVLSRDGAEVTYFFSYRPSVCKTYIDYNHTCVDLPQPAPDARGVTWWISSMVNGPITLTPDEGAFLDKLLG